MLGGASQWKARIAGLQVLREIRRFRGEAAERACIHLPSWEHASVLGAKSRLPDASALVPATESETAWDAGLGARAESGRVLGSGLPCYSIHRTVGWWYVGKT